MSWRLWRRDVASVLGTPPRVIDVAIGATVLVAIAVSVFISVIVVNFLAPLGELPPEADRTPYVRLVFAGAAIGTGLCQLLVAATAAEQNALRSVLSVLPVGRIPRTAGVALPTTSLAAGLSMLLSVPAFAVLGIVAQSSPPLLLGSFGALLGLIALMSATVPAAYSLIRAVLRRRARLPIGYATVLAVVLVAAIGGTIVAPDLVPGPAPAGFSLRSLSPVSGAVALVSGDWFGAFAVGAWIAAAVGLGIGWALTAGVTELSPTIRLLTGPRLPRAPRVAVLWAEVLLLVRTPQFIVLATIPVAFSVALAVARTTPDLAGLAEPGSSLPLIAPFAIGMYGFGITRGARWVGTLAGLPTRQRVSDALLAALIVGAVPSLCSAAVLVGTGTLSLADAGARESVALVLWAAACTGGVIAPFSSTQNLSATVTTAVSFLLFAIATIPLQFALSDIGPGADVLASAIGLVALLGCYFAVSFSARASDAHIA